MTEFTVKEATVFRVATFLNKALRKIEFLRNLLNIQHNQQYKSGMPNVASMTDDRFRLFKIWRP